MPSLIVADLGLAPYAAALAEQRAFAERRISGAQTADVLILCEHPPVVTFGRTSKQKHLLASAELLAARGVEVFEVERGGDVTFHGPGQLVGYPIIDLKRHKQDLHWYLRQVEDVLIRALDKIGIRGERRIGYTGVWTRGPSAVRSLQSAVAVAQSAVPLRKIASIGVHARDWVTWHGFALNVTTDLSFFDLIVPCGIADVTMTSIERELGAAPAMASIRQLVAAAFGEVFSLEVEAPEPVVGAM